MNRKVRNLLGLLFGFAAIWLILSSIGILIPFGEKGELIRSLATTLRQYYIMEDEANRMADLVETNYTSGKYFMDVTREQLWKDINEDLHSICNDEHLLFVSSPDIIEYAKNRIENIDVYNDADRITSNADHHGIIEAKMIDSNIAYLRLDRFANILYGKDALLETLNTLKDASKMIIDLRHNNGGVSEQAQILFSYFTPHDDSMLINADYYRYNDSTKEFWTLKGIGGKSFKREDVCILTSGETFSAAEGFAYDMKHHGKAIIVGERTRGGAHSVDWKILADHYVLRIPVGRGIHPVTGTDWEGVGVQPDIVISSSQALDEALRILREGPKSDSQSKNPPHRCRIWAGDEFVTMAVF